VNSPIKLDSILDAALRDIRTSNRARDSSSEFCGVFQNPPDVRRFVVEIPVGDWFSGLRGPVRLDRNATRDVPLPAFVTDAAARSGVAQ